MSESIKPFSSLFNLLGGVCGLISIGLIIFKGGVLLQTVSDHGKRIDAMEQLGSIGLREHVKMDDERVNDMRARQSDMSLRMTHQEETMSRMMDVLGDVKAINAKLDAMKDQIRSKP